MKNTHIIITVIVIIVVIGLLWKFVIKTGEVTLKDGATSFKRGGNYFTTDSAKVEVQITEKEYDSIVKEANNPGNCVNPNKRILTECTYYSSNDIEKLVPYKGYTDDCGNCRLSIPITKK